MSKQQKQQKKLSVWEKKNNK